MAAQMNRDMLPLPGDDYQILCMKLQYAAKAFNLARRQRLDTSVKVGESLLVQGRLLDSEQEAKALLDACVSAMGEPVELGAVANG
jgi:hypothetical protein